MCRLSRPAAPAEVKIWDRESGKELRTCKMLNHGREKGDDRRVRPVHTSQQATWRACRELVRMSEVTAFDFSTGAVRRSFHAMRLPGSQYDDSPLAAAWSPEGRWTRTYSAPEETSACGKQPMALVTHLTQGTGFVQSAAFSPDGRWLATTRSADTTVNLWNTDDGGSTRRFADTRAS